MSLGMSNGINSIGIIINIVLLVTFIFSLLMGFLRCYKRTFNKLLANIVIILLAIFLSGVVAEALSNFDISFITGESGSATLSEMIVDGILSDYDYSKADVKQTVELAEAIAIGILRLPAYLILLLIGCLIFKPLLRLLFKAVIPFPTNKSLKFKFIGMGIAFASYVIITFFITAPFFGILGMVNQIGSVIDDKDDYESMEIFEYLEDFEEGIVLGTVSTLFSEEYTLQANFTSSLMAIKTKHGSIRIKNELDSHQKLASIIFQSINSEEKNDYNYDEDSNENDELIQAIFDNYDEILNGFRSSDLLDVVMPAAVEILRLEFEDDISNFDKLLDVNWSTEKEAFLDLVTVIFEFAEDVDLDFDKPEEILGNPSLPTSLQNVGTSLDKTGVIKDIVLVYLNDILVEALLNSDFEFEALADVIDLTKLDLENDFYKIGLILNDVYKISFASEEFKVLENVTMIERLIPNIFGLGTIKGNEETIVKFIVDLSDVDTTLEELGININYDNINWSNEIEIFKSVVVNILNLMKDAGYTEIEEADLAQIMVDSNYRDSSIEVIEQLAESELFADSLVMIIVNIMDTLDLNAWKSEMLNEYQEHPKFHAEWAKDQILKTIDLYQELEKLTDITLDTMTVAELDDLEKTLFKVNDLEYVSLDYMLSYINTALVESGIEVQVLDRLYDRNYSSLYDANKDEWTQEIPILIDIITTINNTTFDTNSIKNNSRNVAYVLELMKSSAIFGNDVRGDGNITTDDNIFNLIVINIFEKNGIIYNGYNNGFITKYEALDDDWTRYNYYDELYYLSSFNRNYAIQPDYLLTTLLNSEIFVKYYY